MNRDNQAGKINTIGWIAGFFDGEGYIGLWKRSDNRGYKDTYRPSVVISNTDEKTIVYLSEQLILNGVPNHIKERKSRNGWRKSWVVEISGFERIKKFIYFIEEHVITKRSQVEIMKEFINKRSSVCKNTPYDDRDHEIYEQLKLLKRI